MSVSISVALATACQFAAAADPAVDGRDSVSTLETVRAVATYGYQPVDTKRDMPVIVDSVSNDDIEAPTGDNSIASMLVQVPGVAYQGDGDEPRYITIRGISSDLNVTTLDGLTLATTGENGSGTRRVNLQLVPSDIADRVDVYKAFTAEQDSAAIGGAIDIVTRSAFTTPNPYFMVDGYGIYSSFEGPAGENSGGATKSHWGKGLKTAFARRFGAEDQFGMVFTGRYQDRVRNSSKNWPDQRIFFNEDGRSIAGPDPELGWDGRNGLGKFAYGDYSNVITNKGASLKLEWQPSMDVSTFLMGYAYNRRESSTMNSSDIIGGAAGMTDRTDDTGRVKVNYVQSVGRYNQWDRTASGLISGLDWDIGNRSELSLRAGYTREEFKDDEYWARVRTDGNHDLYFTYRMDGLPQMTSFDGDPFASTYLLNGSNINYARAQENVLDLRADYGFNVAPGALGFGFKTGLKWTRLRIGKDVDSLRHMTGMDYTDYMYDPEYSHHGSNGLRLPWLNYARYWSQGQPPEDASASAHHSRIADYAYREEIANGYLSLHYTTDFTHYILGLRRDHVSFDGRAPLMVDGVLTDDFSLPTGGYSYWLPSLNVVHDLGERWKLRGSTSRTIGRPTPGNIVQAETQTCGEGVTGCVISRGNPDLRPRRSKNYDLALERYFEGGDALAALSLFRKDIEDDIFTLSTDWEEDGLLNRIRQPLNAETSKIQGVELALVNRAFGFHPNLAASFNVSKLSGEMRYATDSATREIDRMIAQPDWMANLTLTYRIPVIDGMVRLSANYQDDYLTGVGATQWNDKFQRARTNVDLSMWHKVGDRWTFKYEIDNLLDEPPEWFHGRDVGGTLSQRDEYGQGVYFHAIYSLN
ncbi:TonB-dependent receptor [Luteimonas sp. MHLX1A]|uniref:TonB-dependent receptor n=1 Tax=Alterluteimonas muca TaxID=2878684 RepID=UPI001E382A01|nr:TonB-dependent receptor [Luteimonas sp. MHLX1A]MCD9045584.1 TonB-dependent receptor [Luteimonas sp. MHLX1A]